MIHLLVATKLAALRASGEAPVPKIIDFGIVKATSDQLLTDKTLSTALEQFIGTPAPLGTQESRALAEGATLAGSEKS
jgi:hypothetical protein